MIQPTVGRIVLYTPADEELAARKGQPYPAIVTHVFSDTCVNLSVMGDGSFGIPCEGVNVTSACHCDEGTPGTWKWMPYQKAQADLYESLKKQLAGK